MWPEGHRSAAAFSFDFDAEELWIGENPANAERPGVLSQGTYGARRGVPELLRLLERCEIQATFFVPGKVAERHPDRVREIIAGGHEIAHHGYTHRSPTDLDQREEEEELLKGREALESFGVEVSGYRSPSWDFSEHTLELLEQNGFTWSSNLMDEIVPYRHEGTGIIELPVQWILDDAPHFWFDAVAWNKKISTNDEVRQIWTAEFEGIHRLGGSTVITMHPQIIGRPGRLPFLEEFIELVKGHETWVTTCGQIVDRARESL